MTQKRFWCGILIVVLIVGLAKPARADKLTADVAGIIVAIVVVGVALAFVVPATIIHYTKKRTITGCVSLGANGMSVTDERDKQIYTLSGETTAIRPGDRMKLRGRKVRSTGPDKARRGRGSVNSRDDRKPGQGAPAFWALPYFAYTGFLSSLLSKNVISLVRFQMGVGQLGPRLQNYKSGEAS
jgi:hypothetical protein